MIGAPVRVNGAYSSIISFARAIVFDADDDAIGFQEILDRRALLEELRIADDAERMRGFARDHLAHALRRCRPARCSCRRSPCSRSSLSRCRARRASTCVRSAEPSSCCGVPTAMNTMLAARTERGRSVVNSSRFSARLRLTISSSPGS